MLLDNGEEFPAQSSDQGLRLTYFAAGLGDRVVELGKQHLQIAFFRFKRLAAIFAEFLGFRRSQKSRAPVDAFGPQLLVDLGQPRPCRYLFFGQVDLQFLQCAQALFRLVKYLQARQYLLLFIVGTAAPEFFEKNLHILVKRLDRFRYSR